MNRFVPGVASCQAVIGAGTGASGSASTARVFEIDASRSKGARSASCKVAVSEPFEGDDPSLSSCRRVPSGAMPAFLRAASVTEEASCGGKCELTQ